MSLNKLRSALPDLIGRTIQHLVFNDHGDGRTQLFLHFTDGTYYEFYGTSLSGLRHLDKGGMEMHRASSFIPKDGRLEIIDAETSVVVERPPAPVVPVPTPPEKLAAKWGHSTAFWQK
jgi:hypothetical protein